MVRPRLGPTPFELHAEYTVKSNQELDVSIYTGRSNASPNTAVFHRRTRLTLAQHMQVLTSYTLLLGLIAVSVWPACKIEAAALWLAPLLR